MQYDVFISYSRRDYINEEGNVLEGNIVTKIKDVLKANGISYWIDEDGINSGDEFARLITDSIKNSKILVFVSTVNSNLSEWTRKEIATAISYKKKIIPFRYDDTPFNDSLVLYLADLDFISYSKNGEKALKRLVASIQQYLKSLDSVNAMAENKRKVAQMEADVKDLNESRKLMMLEIDKSSVLLKSMKDKYNDLVDKINNLNKEMCRLEPGREEKVLERLEDEKKPQKQEVAQGKSKKNNLLWIILLAIVGIYAIVITGIKFGTGKTDKTNEVPGIATVIPETQPTIQPDTKPEVKPEIQPEIKPETQTDVEPEETPEENVEANVDTKPENKPENKPDVNGELKDMTITVKGVKIEMIAVKGNGKVGDFLIGKYEVTQGLWKAVMGTTISQQRDKLDPSFKVRGEGDNMPMYYVNWNDCQDFIKKLNSLTGKKFRLPSEAEWEYAANGGTNGGGVLRGWNEDNSNGGTHAVGGKEPNALGLYDMAGNVSEWCRDKKGYEYVVKGGGWASTKDNCKVSSRSYLDEMIRSDETGLRLVLD